MKLRDLARGSSNPTSFMPAFHIFRSRFKNRETSRRSRKSYESVPVYFYSMPSHIAAASDHGHYSWHSSSSSPSWVPCYPSYSDASW